MGLPILANVDTKSYNVLSFKYQKCRLPKIVIQNFLLVMVNDLTFFVFLLLTLIYKKKKCPGTVGGL